MRVRVAMPVEFGGGVEQVGRILAKGLLDLGQNVMLLGGVFRIFKNTFRQFEVGIWLTWKTALIDPAFYFSFRKRFVVLHGAEMTRDSGIWAICRKFVFSRSKQLAISPIVFDLLDSSDFDNVHLVGPVIPFRTDQDCEKCDSNLSTTSVIRLVTVGRLIYRKGHDLAIQIANRLGGKRRVILDVIGDGEYGDNLNRIASEVAHPGVDVVFHGRVSEIEKDRILRRADCHLFLPRAIDGEYEGFGLVVIEAAAHGVPSVIAPCGGNVYSVKPGQTGILLSGAETDDDLIVAASEAVLEIVDNKLNFQADCKRWSDHFVEKRFAERVYGVISGRSVGWAWPGVGE